MLKLRSTAPAPTDHSKAKGAPFLGYVPALDGVRALAIAGVVSHHYFGWPFGGSLGVDLFFVLSGFLITTLLLEERAGTGRIRLVPFYLRRARRLFPALVVLLASYVAIAWLKGEDGLTPVAKAGFYTANFVQAFSLPRHPLDQTGLAPLWSLAQEEQFYLLWPVVLLVLCRSRQTLRWISLLLIALVTYRLGLILHGARLDRIYYSPDTRSEGLLAGATLAILRANRARFAVRELTARWSICVAFLCAFLLGTGGRIWEYGLPVFELAAVGIVAAAVSATDLAVALSARPLVWIGKISYSLYLWHEVVRWAFNGQERLVALAISVTLAWLSYRYIEQPFRRRDTHGGRTTMTAQVALEPGASR